MPPETDAPPPAEAAAAADPAPARAASRPVSDGWREIEALANAVRALHHQENRGALAALRRMNARRAIEPAFHRVLAREASGASRKHALRLALLTKILALATNVDVLRNGRQNLGDALYAAGVSEARVQMLMTARGSALDDLLLRTARRLVHDGFLPYEDIGKLVLGGPKIIEHTRFRIARAYWARRIPADGDDSVNTDPPSGDDE